MRAYNEFMREQGDTQRALNASGQEEREAELAEKKARRAKIEREIAEREAEARRERKEKEDRERAEEARKVQDIGQRARDQLASTGMVDLAVLVKTVGDRDVEWAKDVLKHEAVLGVQHINGKKSLTLVTEGGWLVRVDETLMAELYRTIGDAPSATHSDSSRISVGWEEIGDTLHKLLIQKSQPAM
jgi:hypothetical protein